MLSSVHLKTYLFYLFTFVIFIVLFSLGNWQLKRGQLKQAIVDKWEQADGDKVIEPDSTNIELLHDYQKVKLKGRFDNKHHIFLDNRTNNGRAGVEVFTPFIGTNGVFILVSRGFKRWGMTRRTLPTIESIDGHVIITGFLNPISQHAIVFKADDYRSAKWPMLVQSLDTEKLSQVTGRHLSKRMIVLDSESVHAYIPIREPKAYMTPQKHWGYAFQWYMLSITWLVLMYFFRRKVRQDSNDRSI
jgi:surfeit locus 1 family protein